MISSPCIDHGCMGDSGGYTTRQYEGRKGIKRHRIVYCEHNKVALKDIECLVVRHLCSNSRCINPYHLDIGTHKDNMEDMVKAGRSTKGIKSGVAKLNPDVADKIRREYECNSISQRALAAKYGVSQATVNAVVRSVRW